MKFRSLDRWHKVGLAGWVTCCLVPGLLVALSRKPAASLSSVRLSELYGREVGGYLSYCPPALLSYSLPLLALCPVLFLLGSIGSQRLRVSEAAGSARLAAFWATLNGFALLLIASVLTVRYGGGAAVAGWGFRLWSSLLFSGLPSLGLTVLISVAIRSRWLALLVGLLSVSVLGVAGIFARMAGACWLPGALDEALFDGVSMHWWRGALFACGWCAFGLIASRLVREIRQRRQVAREGHVQHG